MRNQKIIIVGCLSDWNWIQQIKPLGYWDEKDFIYLQFYSTLEFFGFGLSFLLDLVDGRTVGILLLTLNIILIIIRIIISYLLKN